MRNINQLSKTSSLAKGYQLAVGSPSASQFVGSTYPNKLSIWGLIQYLSTGVFEYLAGLDWFKVPGVPFASLPDPVGLLGARAFCTNADRVPDTLLTVGKTSGFQWGYSRAFFDDAGEISNSIFSPNGGTIVTLMWDQVPDTTLYFILEGIYADSGWNTIVVNGDTFVRTDAIFDNANPLLPDHSIWAWQTVANPFSAEGEVDEIYFGTTGIQFNDPIGGGGSTNTRVFSDDTIWRAG